MADIIIGWDIGGAHVKAALLNSEGELLDVALTSCPLWKGMEHLRNAVEAVLRRFPRTRCRHAVTMTGELVDLFDNREQGVKRISAAMQCYLMSDDVLIYAGRRGFLPASGVCDDACPDIASMNWLASASLAAEKVGSGVFVDIGSTTTDILLLANGKVQAVGLTDYQRLVSAELVYTGIVRTAVMAVAQQARFNGHSMGLMAEYFATMADVYRITGDLNEAHDHSETADGAEKTVEASGRRLSRMTGFEFCNADWPLWQDFARYLKDRQKRQIAAACRRQWERTKKMQTCRLIGAGIGRFLVREIAADFGWGYLDFNDLLRLRDAGDAIDGADCAPAVAVASLALGFC